MYRFGLDRWTEVCLASVALLLAGGCDDSHPVSVVSPLHVITVRIPPEHGTEPPQMAFSNGMALRASPDGPNRYLVRGGGLHSDGPFNAVLRRTDAAQADAHRRGREFDEMKSWPILRADESDSFRTGWVIDLDVSSGTASLSTNESWDRAAGPTLFTGGPFTPATSSTAERNGRPSEVKLPDGRRVLGLQFPSGNLIPAFGGGLSRGLGRSRDGAILAHGSFGFQPSAEADELDAVAKAVLGGSARGNGRLFVQFFDTATEQRLGPVYEAQEVLPYEADVSWGQVWTPDERYVLIVGSRWDVQPSRMSVVISVIPVPVQEQAQPPSVP